MRKHFKQIGDPLELKWKGGTNVTRFEFLFRFFFLWPIMIFFLFWAFLITSLTRQYVIPFVTPQGILMVSDLLLAWIFGLPGIIRLIPKYKKTPIFLIPASKNIYSVIIGILAIFLYPVLITWYWIPNLATQYRSSGPEISAPIFLIAVTGVVFFCVLRTVHTIFCKTEIVIDKINQLLTVQGRTIHGEKFFYNFSLHSDKLMLLVLKGFIPTRFDSLANTPIAITKPSKKTRNYYGVFLLIGSDSYLLYNSIRKFSLKFISEFSEVSGIKYVESQDLFYIKLIDLIHIPNFVV